jgi:hypothetical protein
MASEEALQPQLIVPWQLLVSMDFTQDLIYRALPFIQSAFWTSSSITLFEITISRTLQHHGDQIVQKALCIAEECEAEKIATARHTKKQ